MTFQTEECGNYVFRTLYAKNIPNLKNWSHSWYFRQLLQMSTEPSTLSSLILWAEWTEKSDFLKKSDFFNPQIQTWQSTTGIVYKKHSWKIGFFAPGNENVNIFFGTSCFYVKKLKNPIFFRMHFHGKGSWKARKSFSYTQSL